MTIHRAVAIAAAAVVLTAGCGGTEKAPARDEAAARSQEQRTAPAEERQPRADTSAGGGGAGAPSAAWTEVGIRDVSYPGVKRINAVVLVPLGFSRGQLTLLLEGAAREIAEREGARAVMLDAFRWADEVKDGTFSVGRVYYAPNGNWMDAGTDDPMAAKVELGTLYFRDDRRYYDVSDAVELAGAEGAGVELFETLDTSRSEQVVAELPVGTPAVVVARSIKVFGGKTEHIRYRVRVDAGGRQATGWVAPEALRPRGGK